MAVKIWNYDIRNKKLKYFDVPLGHIKRYILNISIDPIDAHAYCGTRSGDLLEISLSKGSVKRTGPVDNKFKGGVNQIVSQFKNLYVATQDGTFSRIDKHTMLVSGSINYKGSAMSCLAAS